MITTPQQLRNMTSQPSEKPWEKKEPADVSSWRTSMPWYRLTWIAGLGLAGMLTAVAFEREKNKSIDEEVKIMSAMESDKNENAAIDYLIRMGLNVNDSSIPYEQATSFLGIKMEYPELAKIPIKAIVRRALLDEKIPMRRQGIQRAMIYDIQIISPLVSIKPEYYDKRIFPLLYLAPEEAQQLLDRFYPSEEEFLQKP